MSRKPVPAPTLGELTEGVLAYLDQARTRVAELDAAAQVGRHSLTMVEVARDEVREAAKLLQRVYDRTRRAADDS